MCVHLQGDILEIVDTSDPAWWKASKDGKTGAIPYNYVTMIEVGVTINRD